MQTLDLHQAAAFLKIHKETLRRKAASGEIPGAKPGKSWYTRRSRCRPFADPVHLGRCAAGRMIT